jgi:TrmH family RNA methyltransferase
MTEKITSRQNTRVKEAAKLRSARQRTRQSRFLIDGAREIVRALDSNIEIAEAFICPKLCTLEDAHTAISQLKSSDALVADVTPEVFEKLAFGERNDGIVVVAKTPNRDLSQLDLPPKPLVAVLEGLEKPGNVGAILRTADGAGFDAVIVADGNTDLFNPNTIRASLGTIFANQVYSATNEETFAKLQELQLPIYAARPDANQNYTTVDYQNGATVLLGNEAQGLSSFWNQKEVSPVHLPMHGIADSLNVSVTAAILFYEANRQRSQ